MNSSGNVTKYLIWSHLLKKLLMENFTFYAVSKALNQKLLTNEGRKENSEEVTWREAV